MFLDALRSGIPRVLLVDAIAIGATIVSVPIMVAVAPAFAQQACTTRASATIVVNAEVDTLGSCASQGGGACSLRDAITYANCNPGKDTINFNIPGQGVHTINVGSSGLGALPVIRDSVAINGYTQPEATENSAPFGQPINAVLRIVLNGATESTRTFLSPPACEQRQIGGLTFAAGSANSSLRGLVINSFASFGILLDGPAGSNGGYSFSGNFIGTDVTGTKKVGNGIDGIALCGTGLSTIGGSSVNDRNLISGNGFAGIAIFGGSGGNIIRGDYVGSDASGTLGLANGRNGLFVAGSNNQIGNAQQGNLIAFNGLDGVTIPGGTGNSIESSRIFSNQDLAIDLNSDGVTPNDSGDIDSGPNALQNFPVLNAASNITVAGGTVTRVQGTLNSTPGSAFGLQFFSSDSCAQGGVGQANEWVGAANVTTDSNGNANFSADTFAPVALGKFVTATAIGTSGSSELSTCIAVASPGAPTLTSQSATSIVGETVIFTATVAPIAGKPTPTGSVTFQDGANALGTVPLVDGSASLNTTALNQGSHSVTGIYSGDTNYSTSTSAAFTQIVKASPAISLVASPFPLVIGQSVRLTTSVRKPTPDAPTPTGSVTFKDGGVALGTVALDANGDATFTTAPLASGNHFLSATYEGDANNVRVDSEAVTLIKAGDVVITSPLSADLALRKLAATVVSRGPIPGGTVTFKTGTIILGSASLIDGRAEIDIPSSTPGPFTVEYSGDLANGYAPAVSNALSDNVEVNDLIFATVPAAFSGEQFLLTATVLSGTPPTPTGTIEFFDNERSLGIVSVSGGSASLPVSLAKGSHKLKAKYSGDAKYQAAASNFGDVENAGGGGGGGCTLAGVPQDSALDPLLLVIVILAWQAIRLRRRSG